MAHRAQQRLAADALHRWRSLAAAARGARRAAAESPRHGGGVTLTRGKPRDDADDAVVRYLAPAAAAECHRRASSVERDLRREQRSHEPPRRSHSAHLLTTGSGDVSRPHASDAAPGLTLCAVPPAQDSVAARRRSLEPAAPRGARSADLTAARRQSLPHVGLELRLAAPSVRAHDATPRARDPAPSLALRAVTTERSRRRSLPARSVDDPSEALRERRRSLAAVQRPPQKAAAWPGDAGGAVSAGRAPEWGVQLLQEGERLRAAAVAAADRARRGEAALANARRDLAASAAARAAAEMEAQQLREQVRS